MKGFVSSAQRPLRDVPRYVLVALVILGASQLALKSVTPLAQSNVRELGAPPSALALRVRAMGEESVYARLLVLFLQAHDTQPGLSIPLRELNYEYVLAWLGAAQALDTRTQLPLLVAARVYAAVSDEPRRRAALAFLEEQFLIAPNERWRWLAEAAIMAKHRLNDLPLALRLARLIRTYATAKQVPFWAKDIDIVVLEDMGELEAAKIFIGGLLATGHIDDPTEIRFLTERLARLESEIDAKTRELRGID